MWKSKETVVTPLYTHPQHITIKITYHINGDWIFIAIYGCPIQCQREELWSDLKRIALNSYLHWLLTGDFNDTVSMTERAGCSDGLKTRCQKFAAWIDEMELVDLGFTGPKYTWHKGNSVETRKIASLDRAIYNIE